MEKEHKYKITNDNGEITMRDLSTGITLRFMEGDASTLRGEAGDASIKEYITVSQAMTEYAYSCGLLNEADASTLIRRAYRENIGHQIREARHSSGLTTRQLAEKCGLHHSHIVRIEAGRYAVTIDTIGKIANALGLQIKLIEKQKK